MSKSSYREYFANVKEYVKMKPFLKICNIPEPTFSMFMKDSAYDCFLSVERLELLKNCISERLLKIV